VGGEIKAKEKRMKKGPIEKHHYRGQKIQLASGNSYKIILHEPREVQILSATTSGQVDNNLRVFVKADNDKIKHIHKEEKVEIHPTTAFPNNQPFTILLPQTEEQPVLSLFPNGHSGNPIQLPLKSFIDTQNTDPIQVFLFNLNPRRSSAIPVLDLSGDTSYLNGIQFEPVTDNDSSLLFAQEMNSPLNIPDGPVVIDSLSSEHQKTIVREILGHDYEVNLDKEKVEKGEGKPFWAKEFFVKAGVEIHETIEHHILQDFGFKGKFYIKTTNGKQYIIFNGYAGLRKWMTGTRYAVTNPKVFNFSAAGKIKTAMKGNEVTIIIVGAIDIVLWMTDKSNEKQFSDLCVELGMDVLKLIVNSLITAGIMAGVLIALKSFTAPVWVVVVGAIVLGVCVGFLLDLVDNKIGATEYVKEKGREGQNLLEEIWQDNVTEPLGRMYYQLEKSIENLYFNPVGNPVGAGW
jgi:hypothetical protein